MFTGLIETTGTLRESAPHDGGRRIVVSANFADAIHDGDSISVNGVCLTATDAGHETFAATVSRETLRVTALGEIAVGRLVNLERSVRADGRLGGHFVLGHVDGVGRVQSIQPEGECYWLDIETPRELAPYFISKGSVALDGISLTIAALRDDGIGVQIVPFTWQHTTLGFAEVGDPVNVEADVIGKYVARLLGVQAFTIDVPATPARIS